MIILDYVLDKIKEIAQKQRLKKVLLFGSRSRGDNGERSDYDIAIIDTDLSPRDKAHISNEIEEISTLKKIDIVFVNSTTNKELVDNINRDGVVIYEEI